MRNGSSGTGQLLVEDLEPAVAETAAGMSIDGGQRTISQWVEVATSERNFSKKAVVSAGVLNIFQLPAMTGILISFVKN